MADVQNPQAFPHGDPTHGGDLGMTLRDWFAGQVMEQMIRNSMDDTGGWDFNGVAYHAYALADAMLAERAKSEALDSREVG